MKKIIKCLLLVGLSNPFSFLYGQNIFRLEEDHTYALIYCKKNDIVTIKTRFPGNYVGFDNVFKFFLKGDTLKHRMGYESKMGYETSELLDFSNDPIYGHFPHAIKTRNNNFIISSSDVKDSLIFDSQGRVDKIYHLYHYPQRDVFTKLYYLGDTCILGTSFNGPKPSVGLFCVDKDKNLVAWKAGAADSIHISEKIKMSQITIEEGMDFIYDKNKTRIESIVHYQVENGRKDVTSTQVFFYKNGRPFKSQERNKEGKVEYEQNYFYSIDQ